MNSLQCPACENSRTPSFSMVRDRYVRCENCHTVFQSPMPSIAEMLSYVDQEYNTGSYNAYVKAKPMKVATFRKRLSVVNELLPKPKDRNLRHLDIGCAAGFMIEVGLEAGFDSYGVEFSSEAINLADSKIQPRIKQIDVNLLAEQGQEKYDLITCFDIIEHVQNPREFVLTLRRLLTPDGRLLLTTPDVEHPIARVMGGRWPMLQPEQHTVLFSKSSLGTVLQQAGFGQIIHFPAKKTVSYSYMIGQLSDLNPIISAIMILIGHVIPNKLKNRPIMINISEFMTLAKVNL